MSCMDTLDHDLITFPINCFMEICWAEAIQNDHKSDHEGSPTLYNEPLQDGHKHAISSHRDWEDNPDNLDQMDNQGGKWGMRHVKTDFKPTDTKRYDVGDIPLMRASSINGWIAAGARTRDTLNTNSRLWSIFTTTCLFADWTAPIFIFTLNPKSNPTSLTSDLGSTFHDTQSQRHHAQLSFKTSTQHKKSALETNRHHSQCLWVPRGYMHLDHPPSVPAGAVELRAVAVSGSMLIYASANAWYSHKLSGHSLSGQCQLSQHPPLRPNSLPLWRRSIWTTSLN